jgi:hypothetical protein
MLRRGPMMGARRGPGLIGMATRTAVVAGTATAVSGRVRQGQAEKEQTQREAAAYDAQQQAATEAQAAQMQAAQAPAPPAGGITDEALAKLAQLGELNKQGILTDEEFSAQKAKLLGM